MPSFILKCLISGSLIYIVVFFICQGRLNFFLINFKLGDVVKNNKSLFSFFMVFLLFSLSSFAFEDGEDASKNRAFDSLQKSLLVPGWGQFTEKKYLEGAVFLSTELFCLYKIFENNHRSNENYILYKAALNIDDAVKYRDLTEKYDKRRNAFIMAAVGIWAVNLIDIYVIVKNKKNKEKNFKIQIESGENKTLGITLTYRF